VHVRRNQEVREFATGPGFFKVEQDRALALVDHAVDVDEIDAARAQEQLETAQAELAQIEAGESDADRWQVEQRIRDAENQLAVATGGDAARIRPRISAGSEHV
jgi:F0F1-type ATP synthase epsilon subunit